MVEGVETEAQRIFLARHGCAAYPSFLISPAAATAPVSGIAAKEPMTC